MLYSSRKRFKGSCLGAASLKMKDPDHGQDGIFYELL